MCYNWITTFTSSGIHSIMRMAIFNQAYNKTIQMIADPLNSISPHTYQKYHTVYTIIVLCIVH